MTDPMSLVPFFEDDYNMISKNNNGCYEKKYLVTI